MGLVQSRNTGLENRTRLGFFITGTQSLSPLPQAGRRATLLLQDSYRVHFRPSVSPREIPRLFHLVDARGLFGERKERNLWPEPLRSWESMSQHKTTEIILGEGKRPTWSLSTVSARGMLAFATPPPGHGTDNENSHTRVNRTSSSIQHKHQDIALGRLSDGWGPGARQVLCLAF